jgi:hypothetical protein
LQSIGEETVFNVPQNKIGDDMDLALEDVEIL